MATSKKSHNLELISKNDGSWQERRRLPRLSLGYEQFRLSQNQRIFSVTDLSQDGMGLWFSDPDDAEFFSVGLLIGGVLNLKGGKHEVYARVRNMNVDRVGCQFEKLSPLTAEAIVSYLDPSFLGAELKPIPSIEKDLVWYHGPSETDLLLKRSVDGSYSKLSFYALNNFAQWEQDLGLSTGSTRPSDERSEVHGILRLETLFLQKDSIPDPQKLIIAKTVILSSNLPQDLKSWCIRQFER